MRQLDGRFPGAARAGTRDRAESKAVLLAGACRAFSRGMGRSNG